MKKSFITSGPVNPSVCTLANSEDPVDEMLHNASLIGKVRHSSRIDSSLGFT